MAQDCLLSCHPGHHIASKVLLQVVQAPKGTVRLSTSRTDQVLDLCPKITWALPDAPQTRQVTALGLEDVFEAMVLCLSQWRSWSHS